MIGSRADGRRRRSLWGAVVALSMSWMLGSELMAQGAVGAPGQVPESSKPFVLQPPSRLDPPASVAPEATGSPQPQAAPTEKTGADVKASVRVGSLEDVQADSAGTLSEANGGFPMSLWRGTPRPVVEKLLPLLPTDAASMTMRQLTRRLLLSAADVPTGESQGSLLTIRAERLARLGEETALKELLELSRDQPGSEGLARIELDARLASFDMTGACQMAGTAINVSGDAYWQQTMVFCQALAKQRDQAALGVALLRERNLGSPSFFELMDDLNGLGEAKLENLTDPSALTLAMMHAAHANLPSSLMKSGKPSILRFIALSPNIEIKTRLAAAERAEAMGVLSATALREIYAKVEFTKEQRAKPISTAEADGGPLGRALLYRTAADQSVPAARAEALSQALRLAEKGRLYPTMARSVLPMLTALQPGPDSAWFAPEAARGLLVAGGPSDGVGAWLALARSSALNDVEKQKRFFALLPLARLAGIEEAKTWDPELAAWRKTVIDTDGGADRAILMQALLGALRDPVFEDSWIGLLQQAGHVPVMLPAAPVWNRLEPASTAGRVGETVALSLIVLGSGGTEEANPIVLRAVLEALLRIGEEKVARALAVEAAVAAGL